MCKERFVVHRLDAVKGDSYWSSRTARWVSELDGGYQTYGSQKVATRVAGKLAKVGWNNVDAVQCPAQARAALLAAATVVEADRAKNAR